MNNFWNVRATGDKCFLLLGDKQVAELDFQHALMLMHDLDKQDSFRERVAMQCFLKALEHAPSGSRRACASIAVDDADALIEQLAVEKT